MTVSPEMAISPGIVEKKEEKGLELSEYQAINWDKLTALAD